MNFPANTTFLHLFSLHKFIMRLPTHEALVCAQPLSSQEHSQERWGDQFTAEKPDKYHLKQVIKVNIHSWKSRWEDTLLRQCGEKPALPLWLLPSPNL